MRTKFTKNDVMLILGALRRAFSRSDIHKSVKLAHKIEHSDPKHPRCKNWSWCANCGQVVPQHTTDVDHIVPVTPKHKYTYEMTPHEILDSIFCDEKNLANLCETCHDIKSAGERQAKREFRKGFKK